MRIEPIAHVESPFPVKFGVPRQPGLVRGLVSWLVFHGEADAGAAGDVAGQRAQVGCGWLPALQEAGGLLWLVWGFSRNDGRRVSPTIRPPRLGGNARVGVFASRSSFRPNGLAISAVRVAPEAPKDSSGAGRRLALVGADLVDGTPVYGLRPYVPERDCIFQAESGWLEGHGWPALSGVSIPDELLARIPRELRDGVREVLVQDPRPAYTRTTQPGRVFWVPIARLVVKFRVEDDVAVVVDVVELTEARYRLLCETGRFEP